LRENIRCRLKRAVLNLRVNAVASFPVLPQTPIHWPACQRRRGPATKSAVSAVHLLERLLAGGSIRSSHVTAPLNTTGTLLGGSCQMVGIGPVDDAFRRAPPFELAAFTFACRQWRLSSATNGSVAACAGRCQPDRLSMAAHNRAVSCSWPRCRATDCGRAMRRTQRSDSPAPQRYFCPPSKAVAELCLVTAAPAHCHVAFERTVIPLR
jgi:hypothetical protein